MTSLLTLEEFTTREIRMRYVFKINLNEAKNKLIVTSEPQTKEQTGTVPENIAPVYVAALISLQKRLFRQRIEWALWGDLGEALKSIPVRPDCIEIVTSRKGAAEIFLIMKNYAPRGIYFQTQILQRNAIVDGRELPVYLRSHYFEFNFEGVKVKVHGEPQLRIGDFPWENRLEFTPEYTYVIGFKTAIVPLAVKHEFYQRLGWTDRAERIGEVLLKRIPMNQRKQTEIILQNPVT
jgi:hypothetical protein